jgi:hypothetical protein
MERLLITRRHALHDSRKLLNFIHLCLAHINSTKNKAYLN